MSPEPSDRDQVFPPRPGAPREFQHPDEVRAFVEEIRERNRRAIDRYQEYVDRAGGLTGEGFSSDGTVRAEVDADGVLARLDIDDVALRRGRHLAEMILAAIREAQAARALRLAELGTSLTGGRVTELVREAVPEHVRDILDQRDGRR
ncbi:YbaB/EbfC family nucleoid-associated protein [Micromonospora sp. NPDC049559]|uniref:YbaB/EbfC family nucleoid-associated protein n=1 Tax=Micromonospora sp. NPDC049559 TaxID=3155923 RepID=UPI003422C810